MDTGYSGSINPNDVATLSLLGRGGYGYGGGGYGHGFANDSSNAIRIGSSEKLAAQAHNALSQQISDNADRNRDITSQGALIASFTNLGDKINDQSRFFSAEVNSLQREIAANARAAAECCCETKLLAAQNQAKTDAGLASVLANQVCDTRVADAVANATQNAKLDALLADQGRGHHGGN